MNESTLDVAREVPVEGVEGQPLPRFELSGVLGSDIVAGLTVRPADLGLAGHAPVGKFLEAWLALSRVAPGIDGVVVSRQVHGARLAVHSARTPGLRILDGHDGHVTAASGQLLAVTVADCVPVYLAVPGAAVALLHAGWRGIAAGGLESILDRLTSVAGVEPGDVRVHLGIAICGRCYEVGPEVIEAVGAPEGRTLDLRGLLVDRAHDLGIRQVTRSPWCSRHDDAFHSHRRDGVSAGRMVAYLGRRSLDSS